MQDDALMLTQHSVMYGVHSVGDQFATTRVSLRQPAQSDPEEESGVSHHI